MGMSESEDETKIPEKMIEELQRLREQPAILGQTSVDGIIIRSGVGKPDCRHG